jgi:membrane-bound metal-dependent hydrolase YbcI (DUF457 family)
MMGPAHAASGLAAGALTLPLAAHVGVHDAIQQAAWVVALGGFAYLPDLDQKGSTAGSMWGPVTRVLSRVIGVLAVRHRGGTHDIVVAPLVFGGVAFAAAWSRWPSLVLLALAIGLAVQAISQVFPNQRKSTVLVNLAVSFGGAWWLTSSGYGTFGWLPFAVAGGVVVHIAGDWLTTDGVPVPFQTWLVKHPATCGLRAFDAGDQPEPILRYALFPALMVVGLYLNTDFGQQFAPMVQSIAAQAST